MQKLLINLGLGILSIGVVYPYLKKLGLGKFPGDIVLKGENSTFYFPIVTCIVFSLVISIILNIFSKN